MVDKSLAMWIKPGEGSESAILSIAEFKKLFDRHIDAFLERKIRLFEGYTSNETIRKIIGHAAQIIRAGGKRVRPYLAYLSYRMCGGKNDETVAHALVGIELFHVFALVHDDIIDESNERHATQTLHRYVEELLPQVRRPKHTGDAHALLVGDLIFAWSQEAILGNLATAWPDRLPDVQKYFFRMAEEVVVGEMLDVELADRKMASHAEIEEKNRLKTARYTFVNPLKIGAALAGGTQAYEAFFEDFGTVLGQGYQLQDDLLDIMGDPQKTGKDIMRDVEEAQHTFFSQYIFDNGRTDEIKTLQSLWGQTLDEGQKQTAKELFVSSKAVTEGQKIIDEKLKAAQEALAAYRVPPAFGRALGDLVELIKKRAS